LSSSGVEKPLDLPGADGKVSSHDIQSFIEKLNELGGISAVSIIERKLGNQL
jgi:hypothetical protein